MSLVDDVAMAREYRVKRSALWDAILWHPKASTWIPVWASEAGCVGAAACELEGRDDTGALVRILARRILTSEPFRCVRRERWGQYQERVALAWESFVEVRRRWASLHTGLTIWLLKSYRAPPNGYEDLVQDGHEGLMHALDKYDPDYGTRFCTYAAWWIRCGIIRGIQGSRQVHLPHRVVTALRRITTASQAMLDRGVNPTADRLAEATGIPLEQVRSAMAAPRVRRPPLSAASRSPSPEEVLDRALLAAQLREVATQLEERELTVITQRFGLGGERPRTLLEVGAHLGVGRERARQIQVKGLNRLERALAQRQVAV